MFGFFVFMDVGILFVIFRMWGFYIDWNRLLGDIDYLFRYGLGGLVIGIYMLNVLGGFVYFCLFVFYLGVFCGVLFFFLEYNE